MSLDGCGGLDGDAFAKVLSSSFRRNGSLRHLRLRGCGLSARGKAALTTGLESAPRDRAPLGCLACDEWSLRPQATHLVLSHRPAPPAPAGSGGQLGGPRGKGDRGEVDHLWGLASEDLGLIVALLGKNGQVATLEIEVRKTTRAPM